MRRGCAVVAAFLLLTLPLHAEPAVRRCFNKIPTIRGTAGDDELVGTFGPDVIRAGRGADVVVADSGVDRICGGRGHDTLFGNMNRDYIDGGRGNDFCDEENGEVIKRCEN